MVLILQLLQILQFPLVIHEFLDKHPDVKDIEKQSIDAKVTMKHFEESVKKVREQKDLKLGEKLVASYYR